MSPRAIITRPAGQVILQFGARDSEPLLDLSAAARSGNTLFVAGDESAAIERLVRDGDCWRRQETHTLASFLSLPGGSSDEIDIEALDIHDGWLWVSGSHARTRPAPDEDDSPRRALRRIADLNREANRFILGRIPLAPGPKDQAIPVKEIKDREAEQVESGKRSSALMRWIGEDAMLAPYLDLPSKENGFDIEGLAVQGETVWLGLRGPSIRGHAVIVQLSLRGGKRGALKARKIEGGRRVRKYLLPLGGLAVRDLLADGEDLLVLGGATTFADSPARLFRWRGAAGAGDSQIVPGREIMPLIDFPFSPGQDAPEAITDLGDGVHILLHDRPAAARLDLDKGRYTADLYRF